MTEKKFSVITIDAKRWFDRVNGNTYHSVAVHVDGKLVGVNPFEYGYGTQYMQTALELLQKAGLFPETDERLGSGMDKDYYDFETYRRVHRDKFVVIVNDVSARRNLHEGGRYPKLTKPTKRKTVKKKSSPRLSVRGLR
jgi:hypothetical protein